MRLKKLLQERQTAILKRWQGKTLGTYAPDTQSFLRRERDRFANPVGRALLEGTRAILDQVLGDMEAERICGHLEEIIKIRSIQDFTPSQAIGFAFLLKSAVREELAQDLSDARLLQEWLDFESRIDQLALFAFDVYTSCRERLFQIRVNDVKRQVSGVLSRIERYGSARRQDEGEQPDDTEPQSH